MSTQPVAVTAKVLPLQHYRRPTVIARHPGVVIRFVPKRSRKLSRIISSQPIESLGL